MRCQVFWFSALCIRCGRVRPRVGSPCAPDQKLTGVCVCECGARSSVSGPRLLGFFSVCCCIWVFCLWSLCVVPIFVSCLWYPGECILLSPVLHLPIVFESLCAHPLESGVGVGHDSVPQDRALCLFFPVTRPNRPLQATSRSSLGSLV